MEPKHLLQIPRCILLFGNLSLPAVQFDEVSHPHLTGQGRVDANAVGQSGGGED